MYIYVSIMRWKGVYICEYMDSWEKFEETKLPKQNAFYSKLSMRGISYQRYEHAQQVSLKMFIWKQMFYSWQMYLKPSEIRA